MADITWTMVTNFESSLSGVDATAQGDILAYVNDALDVDVFDGEAGPETKIARIYLAAHHGLISLRGDGAIGPVIAESAGGLSRQYAGFSPSGSDAIYDTTPYGKLFRAMLRSSGARVPLVL